MTRREILPAGVEPLLEVEPVPVQVRFECCSTAHPWQRCSWRPSAVEPAPAGSELSVRLFVDEAEGYYLNLTTDEASLFVQWRLAEDDTGIVDENDATPPRALAVTASYNEAGRWMDGGARVDRVPMPEPMRAWIAEYVWLHYEPEHGRKRSGTKPSFMNRDEFAAMTERERDRSDARSDARARAPDGEGSTR